VCVCVCVVCVVCGVWCVCVCVVCVVCGVCVCVCVCVKSEFFTKSNMKNIVVLDVTPCSVVKI